MNQVLAGWKCEIGSLIITRSFHAEPHPQLKHFRLFRFELPASTTTPTVAYNDVMFVYVT